jgi:cysteinyl-tRNA synthetase
MLLLNRRWDEDWDLHDADLDDAGAQVDALYEASARPGDDSDAEHRVLAGLLDDLDVPHALQVALDAGGSAARLLSRALLLD